MQDCDGKPQQVDVPHIPEQPDTKRAILALYNLTVQVGCAARVCSVLSSTSTCLLPLSLQRHISAQDLDKITVDSDAGSGASAPTTARVTPLPNAGDGPSPDGVPPRKPKRVFDCCHYNCAQEAWEDMSAAKKRRNKRNSRLAKDAVIREAGEAVGNSEGTRSVRSEQRDLVRGMHAP